MIPDHERPYDEPLRDLRPASVRREVEASLRRIGVERIDLYQFHWPDQLGTPIEDSWGEMGRLVDEGKVRAAGVSNFDVALLKRAESMRHVDSLQPPLSLVRRDATADVIPWAASHGTGVIVYSPMQSGLLTDTFSGETSRRDGPRRLATSLRGVHGAASLAQHRAARGATTHRGAARGHRSGRRGRVDPRLPRRDGRHRCGRTQPRAGRRLDRRGGRSSSARPTLARSPRPSRRTAAGSGTRCPRMEREPRGARRRPEGASGL